MPAQDVKSSPPANLIFSSRSRAGVFFRFCFSVFRGVSPLLYRKRLEIGRFKQSPARKSGKTSAPALGSVSPSQNPTRSNQCFEEPNAGIPHVAVGALGEQSPRATRSNCGIVVVVGLVGWDFFCIIAMEGFG